MSLPEIWFVAIAVLFGGYFLLEGFDFGVGMLMPWVGRTRGEPVERADARRGVLLSTIGPVWDGNEVWLITAVGAMFAAFPVWYATTLSAAYVPMLLVLLALIVRVVAIEWRGKVTDARRRRWCDAGIVVGSWVPAFGWGLVVANLVHGVPLDSDQHFVGGIGDLLRPYALLGGLATTALFLVHGAVFASLKTDGYLRRDAMRIAAILAPAATVVVLAFAVWTRLSRLPSWGSTLVSVLAVALVVITAATVMRREVLAFGATSLAVVACTVMLFGSLWPRVIRSTVDPAFDVSIVDAASSPYTLTVISWASVVVLPVVVGYQAWTYRVFRHRIRLGPAYESTDAHTPARRDGR